MKHREIVELFKSYYSMRLKKLKNVIDEEGTLPDKTIKYLEAKPQELLNLIDDGDNDLHVNWGCELLEKEETQAYQEVKSMMDFHDVKFDINNADYAMAETEWKHAYLAYCKRALELQHSDKYNLNQNSSAYTNTVHKLGDVIQRYIEQKSKGVSSNTLKTYKQQLGYLTELMGTDFNIVTFTTDGGKSRRYVIDCIVNTPSNRTKHVEIKDKPLKKQIELTKELDLDIIDVSTQNKYIGYISGLFQWATNEEYISKNSFKDAKIDVNKSKAKANRRKDIPRDEISLVLNELSKYRDTKPSLYWGTLIALYTGARRGEVTSLLPTDIKRDNNSGLYYFDITDEEESGKSVKTANSVRIVPIHDELIKLGLLEFVQSSIAYAKEQPMQGNYPTRLLYDFTYEETNKWGRQLGRFVNERLFVDIGIKSRNKVLHSFRHSFISNLSRLGVEGSYIKSMAGHEQGTVTEGIYTHYGIEHLSLFKEAIDKLVYE